MSSPLGLSIVQELHIGNVSYTANSMSTTALIVLNTIPNNIFPLVTAQEISVSISMKTNLFGFIEGQSSF